VPAQARENKGQCSAETGNGALGRGRAHRELLLLTIIRILSYLNIACDFF
jgi:hypothetical protein